MTHRQETQTFRAQRDGIFAKLAEIEGLRRMAVEQMYFAVMIFDPETRHRMQQSARRKGLRADRLTTELENLCQSRSQTPASPAASTTAPK